MFGVPPNTLPANGKMYIRIFCYWILLHQNMSFKTIIGGFNGAFWWFGVLSEDQVFFSFFIIHQNYLVALIDLLLVNSALLWQTEASHESEISHKWAKCASFTLTLTQ